MNSNIIYSSSWVLKYRQMWWLIRRVTFTASMASTSAMLLLATVRVNQFWYKRDVVVSCWNQLQLLPFLFSPFYCYMYLYRWFYRAHSLFPGLWWQVDCRTWTELGLVEAEILKTTVEERRGRGRTLAAMDLGEPVCKSLGVKWQNRGLTYVMIW